jgi:hypothetical protein
MENVTMEKSEEPAKKIPAGEKASITNTSKQPLSIALSSESGSCLEMELLPGQTIGFGAGDTDAEVILHQGDPAGLLIIKPETP